MKTRIKVQRVQLSINQNNESVIFGIVSAEPDYKLSLALNRKLKISLKNDNPVIVNDKPGIDLVFSRFTDLSGTPEGGRDLTSNRSGRDFLLKKLKNIDYLFILHDKENERSINKMLSKIKDIEGVIAAFKIDPGSLKDKNLQYIIQ